MNVKTIIVSGDDALAATIVDELKSAGAHVVKLADTDVAHTEVDLADAGIAGALAVVCAGDDDALNLEIALLAREMEPNVRVVVRLANDVLREALADDNGPGAILNVAELAAPSVVEACLVHGVHEFEAAGVKFVISGNVPSEDGSLQDLYGSLLPVAVIRGKNSPTPGELEVCPARNMQVNVGDWAVLLGTAGETADANMPTPVPLAAHSRRRRLRRITDGIRAFGGDLNPAFYPVAAAVLILMVASIVVLRFGHQDPRMGWIDALYFSIETLTTTGYGDFSFVNQPTWLRLYAAGMMFGGVTMIALLVSFIADVLLSRRFLLSAGRPRVGHLRGHVVVAGLSSLGMRVVTNLIGAGNDVAVIEIDPENRFLPELRELDVPVIFGDATMRQTLETAGVNGACAVAVLTHDDKINIETGIVSARMIGRPLGPMHHRPEIPLVLRVFDRTLGFALARRFGFVNARSTVELAAPWFIGAAIGLNVLDTFSVGQRSFVVGAVHVSSGSELDGVPLHKLSPGARVIAITGPRAELTLHPCKDVRLRAEDTVYVIGPYRELLQTLRKGQAGHDAIEGGDRPRHDSSDADHCG